LDICLTLLILIVVCFAIPSLQSQVFAEVTILGNDNPDAYPTLPELYDRLKTFFDVEAIDEFISRKNQTDPDAAQLLVDIDRYLRDGDVHTIVRSFWSDLEFVDAIFYLYANGLTEIYSKVNDVHRKYGWELIVPPVSVHWTQYILESMDPAEVPTVGGYLNITKRAPQLFQEFLDFLELERVRLFFHEVYKAPALQDLYDRFSDPDFGEHYRKFKTLVELERLGDSLVGAGFEIDTLKKIVEVCMSWENHTSVGLRHDLDSRNGDNEFIL